MKSSHRVILASQNLGKFLEFEQLFKANTSLTLIPANKLIHNADKIDFIETHSTYLENAVAKARLVNHACHYPTLADDSGIEIDAFNGKPGVFSRRFAQLSGYPSAVAQDRANLDLVLQELKGRSHREARMVCTLALVIEGVLLTSTGVLEGTIAEAPRGDYGFGYDPIFIPKGLQKTFSECSLQEKSLLSHRTQAFKHLMEQVKQTGLQFAKP